MSTFDIGAYETVKSRKKRFYKDHPDGRIIVDHIEITDSMAVMKAFIYKHHEMPDPVSTGYAQEFKGQGGFANKHAWLENCEESAIGRALDNAGYAGNDKCSREEMEKVQRAEQAAKNFVPDYEQSQRTLGTNEIPEPTSSWDRDYKIPFGRDKGKTLNEVPADNLKKSIEHFTKDGEPRGQGATFVYKAKQYLYSKDGADEIPF